MSTTERMMALEAIEEVRESNRDRKWRLEIIETIEAALTNE